MNSLDVIGQPVEAPTAAIPARRHLYSVPRRKIRRGPWVPAGRALHLIDIENLMGGPLQGLEALGAASDAYRELVGVGPQDHVVVACNQALALSAKFEWEKSRVLIGHGPDGADMALLRQLQSLEWVAARYDRVVVGSGDGIFAEVVGGLAEFGIPVGVASRPRALAFLLARAATFVIYLPETLFEGAVA